MSSRFHNKWHRHNHHTKPSNDPKYPDSSHDPIASPDSPFQGDFVLQGVLSATGGTFVNFVTANINFPDNAITSYATPVYSTGQFLIVRINNEEKLIRLWDVGTPP